MTERSSETTAASSAGLAEPASETTATCAGSLEAVCRPCNIVKRDASNGLDIAGVGDSIPEVAVFSSGFGASEQSSPSLALRVITGPSAASAPGATRRVVFAAELAAEQQRGRARSSDEDGDGPGAARAPGVPAV